jgi:uncharacterized protein YebE (UPF0316 family)
MVELVQEAPSWAMALAIFVSRVLDVSIGTVRTITVVRGYYLLSAVLGFFEVLLWVGATGQVLNQLDQWHYLVAFAGGFAAGNVVGMHLESLVGLGTVVVRVVSEREEVSISRRLRALGYELTVLEGESEPDRSVEIILLTEERRRLPRMLSALEQVDPDAFYTIEDVRSVRYNPYQPRPNMSPSPTWWNGLNGLLKFR